MVMVMVMVANHRARASSTDSSLVQTQVTLFISSLKFEIPTGATDPVPGNAIWCLEYLHINSLAVRNLSKTV